MSLPPLLRETEATLQLWQRRVRDLVNLIAKQTIDSGPTSARPANPARGTQFYDEFLRRPVWFDGAVWRDAAGNAA